MNFILILISLITGGIAAGSSSPSNPAPNPPSPIPAPNPPSPIPAPNPPKWEDKYNDSDLISFKTQEYNNQWGLNNIKAAEAYATLKYNNKPYGGDDVIVAITDTGVYFQNQDLLNKGDSLRHYDVGSGQYQNNITDDHGTHVAGISSASRNNIGMHGVAFNSKILSVNSLSAYIYGYYTTYDARHSFNYSALENAKVINASWGWGSGYDNINQSQINLMNQHLTKVREKDSIVVISAGNSSEQNPGPPALYSNKGDAIGYMIAVASIDSSNNISNFSNRCGDVKDYCISAPGGSIYSTVGDNYQTYSGTSMAAPHVTGAIAVIRGAWPQLKAPQILEILFDSATKTDSSGNALDKSIYGQGILNLYKAVQSSGSKLIPSDGNIYKNNGYLVDSTEIISSPIFGDSLDKNLKPQLNNIIFQDKYGRDYQAFLDQKISFGFNKSSVINSSENSIFNNIENKIIPINFSNNSNTELKFNLSNYKNFSASNFLGSKYAILDKSQDPNLFILNHGFSFSHQPELFSKKLKIGFTYNYDEISATNNKEFGNNYFTTQSNIASNPFQSFFNSSTKINNNFNSRKFSQFFLKQDIIDKKLTIKLSYQTSFDNNLFNYKNFQNKRENESIDFNLFLSPSSSSNYLLSAGELSEFNNNILNSKSSGAFSSNNNVKTPYFKISSKHNLTDHISFHSSIAEGFSKIKGNQFGIFRNFSNVRSKSLSFGLSYDKFFNGIMGIGYTEPMRVYKGNVDYDIPIAVNENGDIIRKKGTSSLVPIGKEKNYEIFYSKNLDNYSQIGFNFIVQKDAFNIKSPNNDYLSYINYRSAF